MTFANEPEARSISAGAWRLLLLGPIFTFAGFLFLFFALVALFIDIDGGFARLGLLLLSLMLALLGVYFFLLVTTLALRIEVRPDGVSIRAPKWRGAVPWFPWIKATIPFSEIAGVETRDEVYSSLGLTTIQTAYSLVTKDGHRIVFGYTSPQGSWGYPFADISGVIAARSNTKVVDRGAIAVGGIARSTIHDLPSWDSPSLTADEGAASQGKAALTMQIAFALVAIAVAIRARVPHDN